MQNDSAALQSTTSDDQAASTTYLSLPLTGWSSSVNQNKQRHPAQKFTVDIALLPSLNEHRRFIPTSPLALNQVANHSRAVVHSEEAPSDYILNHLRYPVFQMAYPGADLSQIPAAEPPPGIKFNFDNPESQAWMPRVAAYVTLPPMIIFLAMRIYARLRSSRFGLDDGMLLPDLELLDEYSRIYSILYYRRGRLDHFGVGSCSSDDFIGCYPGQDRSRLRS